MPGQLRGPLIDRRPDARIVRSALDEVKAIQTLLSDVYKDAGDGRTLLKRTLSPKYFNRYAPAPRLTRSLSAITNR